LNSATIKKLHILKNKESNQKLLEWSDGNFSFDLKTSLQDGVTKEELIEVASTMHYFD
jgi:hypothetical protein